MKGARFNRDFKILKSPLTAVDFIRPVMTVHASIAPPAAVDAFPIGTLKLMDAATVGVFTLCPADLRPFIGPISTICVSITAPLGQYAHRVVALEGAAAASGFGAGSLV